MLEEVDKEIEEEHCAVCDELIDECQCEDPPKCPICGDEADLGGEISLEHFDCDHFIAGWDDSGFSKSPLGEAAIPVLSNKVKAVKWSPEKLKEVFGEAEPLLEAYGGVFTDEPDYKEFSDILLMLLPDVVEQSFYDQPPGAMIGWEAVMYFAKEPDAAQKHFAELMVKLREGFKYLENSSGDNK